MDRAATNKRMLEIIAGFKFVYAKTMPEWPHWYVVRRPEIDAEYRELFDAIGKYGDPGSFFGQTRKYYRPGDGYKYWRMTDDINISKIINRAKEDGVDVHN